MSRGFYTLARVGPSGGGHSGRGCDRWLASPVPRYGSLGSIKMGGQQIAARTSRVGYVVRPGNVEPLAVIRGITDHLAKAV